MTDSTLTPSRLWKRMTPEQRLAASRAFWQDEQAANDQAQAAFVIAQQKKFRPKTIMSMDEERKARHLASLPSVPDVVAGRALIVYHLADHRPMMGTFLDLLGIPHEDGVIQEDNVVPEPSKLGPAAAKLLDQFPREHVSLYLNTLLCQDPETWGGLAEIVRGLDA
jgi:hypothetical protein